MIKDTFPNVDTQRCRKTKKCIYNDDNVVVGTLSVAKDITDMKIAEAELDKVHKEITKKNLKLRESLDALKAAQSILVNSEKLAALGQLIAGIAHEINTPLGAINASNSNIQHSLDKIVADRAILFNAEEINLLDFLVSSYRSDSSQELNSREKRSVKKDIARQFGELGNPNATKISEIIVYLNLHGQMDRIISNSRGANMLKVLETAKNLVSLRKNSRNVEIAVSKASNVVQALKKYVYRTPDGEKYPTDLIDNIETVLTLNHNIIKQGITIEKVFAKIPNIYVYPDEISQVWNNIITNAIHAMDNRGKLIIEVSNDDKFVFVKFTDNGCGIPLDIKDKIFTPFFTTKEVGEGTGLGLDIIKRVVEKHNGTICIESEVNKGSTFIIQLPIN